MQSNYGTYSSYPKTAAALISLMLTQIRKKKNNNNLIENVCHYTSLRKSWDKKLTVHTGCQTSKFGEGVPQPAAYSTLKEVAQLSASKLSAVFERSQLRNSLCPISWYYCYHNECFMLRIFLVEVEILRWKQSSSKMSKRMSKNQKSTVPSKFSFYEFQYFKKN